MWLGGDASPDGGAAALVVCDGDVVEVVDHRPGLHWAVDRIVEVADRKKDWKKAIVKVDFEVDPELQKLS